MGTAQAEESIFGEMDSSAVMVRSHQAKGASHDYSECRMLR